MNAPASRFSDIAAVGARLRHFAPQLSLFALKGDLSFPKIPPALDSRMTIEAFDADDSDFPRCQEVSPRSAAGRAPSGPGGRSCDRPPGREGTKNSPFRRPFLPSPTS